MIHIPEVFRVMYGQYAFASVVLAFVGCFLAVALYDVLTSLLVMLARRLQSRGE